METKVKKLVVPVAGQGTRFLPITKAISKEMLPILNKPLIHYICDEAVQSGITDIIFVINREKTDILNYFKRSIDLENKMASKDQKIYNDLIASNFSDINIYYVEQKEALGLGHAIWCAKELIHGETFAVSLPDELFLGYPGLKSLLDDYKEGHFLSLKKVPIYDTDKYGIIEGKSLSERLYEITNLVEKPKENPPSNIAITGRYILDYSIFESLEKMKIGTGGEIQLTDAIQDCMSNGIPVNGKLVESVRFDCGNPTGWLEANNHVMNKLKMKESLK